MPDLPCLGHILRIFIEQHGPHCSQELGNRADHFKRLLRRRQAKGQGTSVTADQEEYD